MAANTPEYTDHEHATAICRLRTLVDLIASDRPLVGEALLIEYFAPAYIDRATPQALLARLGRARSWLPNPTIDSIDPEEGGRFRVRVLSAITTAELMIKTEPETPHRLTMFGLTRISVTPEGLWDLPVGATLHRVIDLLLNEAGTPGAIRTNSEDDVTLAEQIRAARSHHPTRDVAGVLVESDTCAIIGLTTTTGGIVRICCTLEPSTTEIQSLTFEHTPAPLVFTRQDPPTPQQITAEQDVSAELRAWLDHRLVRTTHDAQLVGAIMLASTSGSLRYASTIGTADLRTNTPIGLDTGFRIASVSKTMTAVAIMQLVEDNLIDLDDAANQHLESIRITSDDRDVTIRQLLTHTSGIIDTWGIGGATGDQPLPTINTFYANGIVARSPGSKREYSNHGYAILGQLIEDVTRTPFAARMRTHVLDPLDMRHSDFELSPRIQTLATGYESDLGSPTQVEWLHNVIAPAGGLSSTPRDMLRYADWLTSDSRAVLDAETRHTMFTPHAVEQTAGRQGLGFNLREIRPGLTAAWHNGLWNGFTNSMWIVPERRLSVLALANTHNQGRLHALDMLIHNSLPRLLDEAP